MLDLLRANIATHLRNTLPPMVTEPRVLPERTAGEKSVTEPTVAWLHGAAEPAGSSISTAAVE